MAVIKDQNSLKERGERVIYVREKLLGLKSRPAFFAKTGIPVITLRQWESVQGRRLGEKGARRLVETCQKLGVTCTVEWLLFGHGDPPFLTDHLENRAIKTFSQQEIIHQELALFHRLNENAIDTIVQDDGMLPYLSKGDHVAGINYVAPHIKNAIGEICIVQTADEGMLVRYVELGQRANHYNLVCLNPKTAIEKVMKNVDLVSAAPIIWIRKVREISST